MKLTRVHIERTFLVNRIECLGLVFRPFHTLLRDDAQAGCFDHGIDLAGQVATGGIGLDDGECALDGHGAFLHE